jgi:hypothetical protein
VTFGASAVAGNYILSSTWGSSAVNVGQITTFTKGTIDFDNETNFLCGVGSYTTNFAEFSGVCKYKIPDKTQFGCVCRL